MNDYISDIAPGHGGLKYYNYFANNIKLKTKESIKEVIRLKISNVIRKDKLTNKLEKFNYKIKKFKEVKK